MNPLTIYKEEYCISTEKSKLDLRAVHQFLSTEAYWCLNIPLSTVQQAAAHSLTFGVYHHEQQIGYARVISDYTTIAYLGDVYILPEHRGRGLSKWLMETIMNHTNLQGLRRWILLTADAHGLYRQFGFTDIASPERWMEIHQKNPYTH